MTPDHPDVGVLFDALREGRRESHVLECFGVAWAEELGVDGFGLWALVAGIRLRWIRAGCFVMGSPQEGEGRSDIEPLHEVEIRQGFWLGETPVTQHQWSSVTGDHPRHARKRVGLVCRCDGLGGDAR